MRRSNHFAKPPAVKRNYATPFVTAEQRLDALTDDAFLSECRDEWYTVLKNCRAIEDHHRDEAHAASLRFNRCIGSAERTKREHLIPLAKEQAQHELDWMQRRRSNKPAHIGGK